MEKLHVIYAGNSAIAIPPLEALLKDKRFVVTSVVCNPPKEKGRGKNLSPAPVCAFAKLNKLIIHEVGDIQKIESSLRPENTDFMVVFAFGQILPKSTLTIPKYCCVNIHPSLLPKYRGASPIQEALLHGDKEIGIILIRMNEAMDEGDILKMEKMAIEEGDNAQTLGEKLAKMAATLLPDTLADFARGMIKPQKQDSIKATYCRKIEKNDGRIDFSKETAKEIMRKIRAYTPWPSAFFFLDGKRIKILHATHTAEQKISSGFGEIVDSENLALGSLKGTLYPLIIQQEGRKSLSIKEFLKGYRGNLKIS